jgi:hypothetical protein
MKNLFINKAYLQENLRARNIILLWSEVILFLISITFFTILFILVVNIDISETNPSQPRLYWFVLTLLSFVLLIRFIGWNSPYLARKDKDSDSGKFILKDHPERQKKFFTFMPHKRGDTNPLW